MKWPSIGSVVLLVSAIAMSAAVSVRADDGATPTETTSAGQDWSWTGFYIGAHAGAAWGKAYFSDPFGPSIYGDAVNTPAFLFGGQIGFNWQVPGSRWVFGTEADVSRLVSDGTNTCLAYSGFSVSANCRVRADMAATLTGRAGYAAGPSGRSLLYLKGGLAGVRDMVDITTNAIVPPSATSASIWKLGWTVGAGLEQAIAPGWSLKLEYDYLGFGASGVNTPGSVVPPATVYMATAPATSDFSQSLHMVKLGLNYRFGMGGRTRWPTLSSSTSAGAKAAMPMGWEAELGGRYWFSTGRFQKDLGSTTVPSLGGVLNSRLTYDSTAHSGEFFGRVETPWNVFVKGFVGAGTIAGGTMNDEDWMLSNLGF